MSIDLGKDLCVVSNTKVSKAVDTCWHDNEKQRAEYEREDEFFFDIDLENDLSVEPEKPVHLEIPKSEIKTKQELEKMFQQTKKR